MGPLRTAEVSMTLTFLDPRSGRLVTIKVPEEPPRQPLHPRAVLGSGPEAGRVYAIERSLRGYECGVRGTAHH